MPDILLTTIDLAPYLSAFLIGFLGSAHCIGMCGGLMSALSFSIPEEQVGRRFTLLLSYNIGRILSYTFIGALAGWLGFTLSAGHGLNILRIIAGLLLISMGLYLAGWWHGLTYLERLGGLLWRRIQPYSKRLLPVTSLPAALLLGGLWGWLPCGLVYTALVYGLSQASVSGSALVMFAFGLGTLPVLLVTGVLAERVKSLMQKRGFRTVMALLIVLFGCWTIWGGAGMGHGAHNQSGGHVGHEMPMEQSDQLTLPSGDGSEGESIQSMDHSHHH